MQVEAEGRVLYRLGVAYEDVDSGFGVSYILVAFKHPNWKKNKHGSFPTPKPCNEYVYLSGDITRNSSRRRRRQKKGKKTMYLPTCVALEVVASPGPRLRGAVARVNPRLTLLFHVALLSKLAGLDLLFCHLLGL